MDAGSGAAREKAKLRLSPALRMHHDGASSCQLAALLCALIAMLQLIRAVGGWQIMVNGTLAVLVRASSILCLIAAALA
jgi:hypothetical protein